MKPPGVVMLAQDVPLAKAPDHSSIGLDRAEASAGMSGTIPVPVTNGLCPVRRGPALSRQPAERNESGNQDRFPAACRPETGRQRCGLSPVDEDEAVDATSVRYDQPFSRVLRLSAWGCVGLIAVLSLLPAQEMVRTSLGGHVEHATAYAGTAALLRLSYPTRWKQIAAALVIYAGLLELLQNFSPDRHPTVADWLSSSTGALTGIAVISISQQIWWRRRRRLRLPGQA
jgi:VanZ family protein